MSALGARLCKLETTAKGKRCATCRDWPPMRVRYVNDPSGRHPEPETPERCPRCGWQPLLIAVEYVEGWRGPR